MDLIETLDVLADVAEALISLAREQAVVIEQYHLTELCNRKDMEQRLADLDEKLAGIACRYIEERR